VVRLPTSRVVSPRLCPVAPGSVRWFRGSCLIFLAVRRQSRSGLLFGEWAPRPGVVLLAFLTKPNRCIGSIIVCAAQNIPMLIVGRIINGFSVGICSAQVPVYISELVCLNPYDAGCPKAMLNARRHHPPNAAASSGSSSGPSLGAS
jgi:MFS family permease